MLFEIITAVTASEPDVEIIAVPDTGGNMLDAARSADADLIIVRQEDADGRAPQALMLGRPTAKVLEIIDFDREGVLHELRPIRIPLGELSAAALLSLIRSARPTLRPPPS
jgi:hypothetical protein